MPTSSAQANAEKKAPPPTHSLCFPPGTSNTGVDFAFGFDEEEKVIQEVEAEFKCQADVEGRTRGRVDSKRVLPTHFRPARSIVDSCLFFNPAN
eukprot:9481576-Pyramimonas_sp.AAC.1